MLMIEREYIDFVVSLGLVLVKNMEKILMIMIEKIMEIKVLISFGI